MKSSGIKIIAQNKKAAVWIGCYDFDNEKVSVADTWSMWFSQTYAQSLLDAGFKTIGFTVTIPNPELYITVVEQREKTAAKIHKNSIILFFMEIPPILYFSFVITL